MKIAKMAENLKTS